MHLYKVISPSGPIGIAAKTVLAALELYYRKYDAMPAPGITKMELTPELCRRCDDYMMFRRCGILGHGHEVDDPFFVDIS